MRLQSDLNSVKKSQKQRKTKTKQDKAEEKINLRKEIEEERKQKEKKKGVTSFSRKSRKGTINSQTYPLIRTVVKIYLQELPLQ